MRTHVDRVKRLILGLSNGLGASAVLLAGCNEASSDSSTTQVSSPTAGVATTAQAGSQGDSGPAETFTVAAKGFLFRLEVIEVQTGATVTWENSDQILHTVTSGEPEAATDLFDGQMEGAGTSFSRTFDAPGRFPYFCSRHLHMRGEVIVR